VLPAAATAALVFGVGLLLAWAATGRLRDVDWRRAGASLAVLALAAGVAASPLLDSWMRDKVAVATTAGDTETATRLTDTYHFRGPFPWVPDGKWWHWGWYAIGLALAVEFVARIPSVGVGVGHLLRGTAAGVIAAAVVPPGWLKPETRWWLPLAGLGLAGQWAVVDAVGRRNPGGSVTVAVAVACLGAATVFLHDGATGFTDLATFLFAGLAVLTLLAWATGTDAGAAGAVTTVAVAALLLMNHDLRSSDPPVPTACYWLVGLAPLGLGVFLVPPLRAFGKWRLATPAKVLLAAVPVGWAVYRCVTEAPYTFGEKW
jgi:hypothetical protein